MTASSEECLPPVVPIGLVVVRDESGSWVGELLEPIPEVGTVAVAKPRKDKPGPPSWDRVVVGIRRVTPMGRTPGNPVF